MIDMKTKEAYINREIYHAAIITEKSRAITVESEESLPFAALMNSSLVQPGSCNFAPHSE